jgi:hypothetical protein
MANLKINNDKNDKEINSELKNYINYEEFNDTLLSNLTQFEKYNASNFESMIRIAYKEPVNMLAGINFVAKTNYAKRNGDNNIYNFNETSEQFDLLNQDLSSTSYSDYLINRAEIGYSSFGMKMVFNLGIAYENIKINNAISNTAENTKYYHNILPVLFGKYFISKNQTLIFYAGSRTSVPSLNQYDNRLSFTDPLQVTMGNKDLKPGIQHVAMTRYSYTVPQKSIFLSAYGFVKYGENLVSTQNFFLKENTTINNIPFTAGTKITEQINISNLLNCMAGVDLSFPVSILKSNLNTSLKYSYLDIPSIIDNDKIYSRNSNYTARLALVSNISHNIDFTISNTSEYKHGSNSHNDKQSDFFRNTFSAELYYILNNSWNAEIQYTNNDINYYENTDKQNYHILNLAFGKYLFKQKSEIKLRVFDILSQNKAYDFKLHETYKENIYSNVIQQYFMLSMSYKF